VSKDSEESTASLVEGWPVMSQMPGSAGPEGDPTWQHLDERIDAAMEALAEEATAFVGFKPGTACAESTARFAPLIRDLIEACAHADVRAGRSAEDIAGALGIPVAVARRAYGHGPANLPLSVISLDDPGPGP
jgi:hypothetical protein